MTKEWVVEFDGGNTARHHQTPVEALEEAKMIYERDLAYHVEYCKLMRRKRELEWELDSLNEEIQDHQNAGTDLMPDIKVYDEQDNGDRILLWENGKLVK